MTGYASAMRQSFLARLGRAPQGSLLSHPATGQFLRYASVGLLNLAVFFGVFNLLLHFAWHPAVAYAAAFVVTSIGSFWLNKSFAFKDRRREAVVRQYLAFVFMTGVGLAINESVFWILLYPLRRFGTAGHNAAALGAVPFSVMWNFFAYRKWVFAAEHRG